LEPDLPIGERIRNNRLEQGRSQAVIAGLCGITEDYLSRIERGLKMPALDVLMRIARELRIPLASLLSDAPLSATPSRATFMPDDIAQSLFGYSGNGPWRSARPPAELRERVEVAWRTWQTSKTRFTDTAALLPGLITDVEAALRAQRTSTDGAARRETQRCAADLYFLLRSYCRRTGRTDLSLLVADRAKRAAEEADDPIRIAAAQWNLGHILLGTDDPAAAREVALSGVAQLRARPGTPEGAMAGALELVAVVADARSKRRWAARDRLRTKAKPQATAVGEGNLMWTVFGPTNVILHAVSLDMEAGESSAALRLAEEADTTSLPSLERQFTFQLEVTRCWDLRREDAAVLVHLLELESLAPEDVARNPLSRQMITDLRRRVRPTYRKQAVALADRLGIE
jgi:transcriptional regulator with XRE-family HTH domain